MGKLITVSENLLEDILPARNASASVAGGPHFKGTPLEKEAKVG